MKFITNLRKISNTSLGFTISKKILEKFPLKQGNYKTEMFEENGTIIIKLTNIWGD